MPKAKFVPSYRPRLRILIDPVYQDSINQKFYVDKITGCYVWTGALTGRGYPAYTTNNPKKTHAVHRLSLAGKLGRPIARGMNACHTCDCSMCINPEHLYEGSQVQNMCDKHARGRHPTRYTCRALSDVAVKQIRLLVATGSLSQYATARRYGISRSVVQGIVERTKYKDVI